MPNDDFEGLDDEVGAYEDDFEIEDDEEEEEDLPEPEEVAIKRPRKGRKRGRGKEDDRDGDFVDPVRKRDGRTLTDVAARSDIEKEYEEMIDALDLKENFKVMVTRIAPQRDEEGNTIAGFIETHEEKMYPQDLKELYGGGKYKIQIKGPDARNPRKSIFKAQQQLVIGGPPKIANGASTGAGSKLIKEILEQERRDRKEEARQLKEHNEKLERKMEEEKKQNMETFTQLMQLQQEQRRQEEERRDREDRQREERLREERRIEMEERREERRMEEERRREEREEARREERERREEERRREERAREERRLEEERRREERQAELAMQQQREALRIEQLRLEQERQSQIMELVLSTKNASSDQQLETQKMLMTLMQGNSDKVIEIMKSAGKGDPLDQFEKFARIKNLFDPPAEDKATWEKVTDRLEGFMPAVVGALAASNPQAAAALAAQQEQGAPQDPGAPQAQPTEMYFAPGNPSNMLPPASQPQEHPPEQSNPTQTAQAPGAAHNAPPEQPMPDTQHPLNDLTEFTPIPKGVDVQTQAQVLVKNIDLAIQKDVSAKELMSTTLAEMPILVKSTLKNMPEDEVLALLADSVPPNWAIASPRGQEYVKEVLGVLKD